MRHTDYHDEYGFLHHVRNDGNSLTSENGPLFTGIELVLKFRKGKATPQDARNFMASLSHLHGKKQPGIWSWVQRKLGWDWQVTPVSNRYDFSKDNWFGVWAALILIRRHYHDVYKAHKTMIDAMPVFHKQLLWPTSWMIVLKSKHGIKLFDSIIKADFMRTARETHKKRGGRLIAKTDGKIMAWSLMYAFDWDASEFNQVVKLKTRPKPLPINNKNVPKCKVEYGNKFISAGYEGWYWGTWKNVVLDYFPDYSHPIVKGVSDLGGIQL